MYQSKELGSDLRDVLDTLQELKRAVEQQARVRTQLEAENGALTRRVSDALAAERQQRRRAIASRVSAKRAHATIQSVLKNQREFVAVKQELALQQKKIQEERKVHENKISALQLEITRVKEEYEASLAAAEFAKEDAIFGKSANQVSSSSASAPTVASMPRAVSPPPPPPPPTQLQTRPTPLQPQQRNANALWTGSGQLVWNPPPVNLTSMTNRPQAQCRPRKTAPTTPRYKSVVGFRTASQLMQSSNSIEEPISQACDSQVSQSDLTDRDDEQFEADGDCVIVTEGITNKRRPSVTVKIEDTKKEDVRDDSVSEIRVQEECTAKRTVVCTATCSDMAAAERPNGVVFSTVERPLKKPRKKRKMFTTPLYDQFTI